MKTSLSHIPLHKQDELQRIIKRIKKKITAEMIILFWSYARGDFVEKDVRFVEGHYEEHRSDFDILVINKKPTQEKNMRLAGDINTQILNISNIDTPTNIIVEDIHHINKNLQQNRYFYADIKRDGIMLYDSWKYKLAKAKLLSREEQAKMKKEDFEMWFKSWEEFLFFYKIWYKKEYLNNSAFLLHQATEKYITAFNLVKTWYKPKTHDLEILYKQLVRVEPKFWDLFNFKDKEEQRHFELLRKAYVEARYSKEYKITKGELKFLEGKILILRGLVDGFCGDEVG